MGRPAPDTPLLHTGAPPFNYGPRRQISRGGPAPERGPYVGPHGIYNNDARAPGDLNDGAIQRERMPYYHQSYYAAPDFLVSWTAAGPARPSLGMRNVTIRTMAGTSNTRAQDPVATGPGIQDGNGSLPGGVAQLNSLGIRVPQDRTPHGMHSRIRDTKPQSFVRARSGAAQMRPGRQNRLSNSVNHGQSYSQTTVPQGM